MIRSGPRTFIRPSGRPDSRFAFFGEQPGKIEIEKGRVFSGPAGDELDRCLDLAHIPRSLCYLSNILKDFDSSPDDYIQLYQSKKLLREPIIHEKGKYYLELLRREVSELSTEVIGAFGGIALFALTGRTGITNYRGSILPCLIDGVEIPNKRIVPSFHPATVIPPKNQFLNRRLIVHDMERLLTIADGLYVPTDRQVYIKPSLPQALDFLAYCKDQGLKGERVSYDIEVFMDRMYKQVSCISFAVGHEGMSIPFADHKGDILTIGDEMLIWEKIGEILESSQIRKCGQNLTFDAHFLLRVYGIHMTNADDTMIAQKTIMPDYPVGLDFLTSWWTDHIYYKQDGKDFFAYGGQYEKFWHYNTLDSIMCSEIFPKQEEVIFQQENQSAYERQRKMIEPCCYMMERGLLTNVEAMDVKAREIADKIEKTQRDITDFVGWELNPNSGKDLLRYFRDEKKTKPYLARRADGSYSPTFDDIAMKRLARKGHREIATLVLEKRRLVKQLSNYLDVRKVDSDKRSRCQYKPSGTRYSRLASAENIFGSGGNQQNIPAELQEFLIPDPGYAYGAFDLDQAENRIVAYVGEILNMIEVFEKGEDVHAKTALFLVAVFHPDTVLENFNVRNLAPMGDGTHSWRDWGKKCVTGDTEVLTPVGWVRIDKLDWVNMSIAQWSWNREIRFVKVEDFNAYEADRLIELTSKRVSLIATPNHKVPMIRKDQNLSKVVLLEDLKLDMHYGIPLNGFMVGNISSLNKFETMLLVAFQADGTYINSPHSNFNGRFRFKKDRKIDRILRILTALKITATVTITADDMTNIYFKRPNYLTKIFGPELLLLGQKEMQVFVNEVSLWDGHRRENGEAYFTTIKNNAEWVQTIAHLSGYSAIVRTQQNSDRKLLYIVKLSKISTGNIGPDSTTKIERVGDKTPVYCPTVQSGFFIGKHNGKISIFSNSNHGFNYDWGSDAFALKNEIPNAEGSKIYEAYHTLYPGVKRGFHAHVRRCLRINRQLTNLMGRKTVFLDKLDSNTFKEAFSCIPQGTVGDIINERGIEYIYYNQDLFDSIELLRQVHDEIGFQNPLSIGWRVWARQLNMIKSKLETPLVTHYGREFVIPASFTLGKSLNKRVGFDIESSKWPEREDKLAKLLELGWEWLHTDFENADARKKAHKEIMSYV